MVFESAATVVWRTRRISQTGGSTLDWTALSLSLRLASATTVILFVAGIPISYWLAKTQSPFCFLIEAVVALPLVLPPTVLGFCLLIALGPRRPFGQMAERALGIQFPFTFTGILIGSVLFNLPFAVRPFGQFSRSEQHTRCFHGRAQQNWRG